MSSLDYLDLCRLCLVKDRVSVPIFEGEGDVRQIFLKIAACLPVKVAREDKLPKKICDDCTYKVELLYQFWNTTANAEKQLLQWLGEVGIDGKQGYVTNTLNQNVMKQEQSTENRLDGGVLQQVNEHQNNMNIGMMDNMGLGIPMMISSANQQQITSVPMDTGGNSVQTVQAVPGPSSQTTHNQISQNQTSSTTQQEEEEESSEEDENSDDECDGDEGLPVKEESEEDPSSRTIEPTTFVNVSLACDEAGPSGLQQQKISDMSEIPMQQSADGDPKSGMSTITETAVTRIPVQPLFVVCHGTSVLDQEERSRTPIESRSIVDDEDQSVISDVESNKNEQSVVEDGNDDDLSSDNNDTHLSEINHCTLLDVNNEGSSQGTVSNDSLPVTISNSPVPVDSPIDEVKTALVPVRDPITKEIKNQLVPFEIKDESGLNVIKSVVIPVKGEDGLLSYEVRKVTVPIQSKLQLLLSSSTTSCQPNLPQTKTEPIKIDETLPDETNVEDNYSVKYQEAEDSKSEKDAETEDNTARNDAVQKEVKKDDTIEDKEANVKDESENEGPKADEPLERMLGNTDNMCPYCQKVIENRKRLGQHIRRNHTKPYRCDKCYHTYVSKEAYEVHVKTHEKPSYLECPFCRQRYKRMGALRFHQIRVHSTIEPQFECDYCKKRFKLKNDLTMHIDRLHTGDKHVCRFCGKNVRNIMNHEWQHKKSGRPYPFQCHLCPSKFRKSNGLENHLQRHKSGFKCNKCGEIFSRPSRLISHRQTKHKPAFFCTICKQEFNCREKFYLHVIRHAKLRPYNCDVCDADFFHRTTLVKHRNTHPGPLPPLKTSKIAHLAKKVLQHY